MWVATLGMFPFVAPLPYVVPLPYEVTHAAPCCQTGSCIVHVAPMRIHVASHVGHRGICVSHVAPM